MFEERPLELSEKLWELLLYDQTTRKNICWATDHYVALGRGYQPHEPMTKLLVADVHGNLIQPRVSRSEDEKTQRTKDMAEVFTPSG